MKTLSSARNDALNNRYVLLKSCVKERQQLATWVATIGHDAYPIQSEIVTYYPPLYSVETKRRWLRRPNITTQKVKFAFA